MCIVTATSAVVTTYQYSFINNTHEYIPDNDVIALTRFRDRGKRANKQTKKVNYLHEFTEQPYAYYNNAYLILHMPT